MVDLRKLVGEIVIPSASGAPKSAIFSGLPALSEIPIEPRIEDASRAVVIDDSDQLDRLQDQTQEMAPAFEISSENVVNLPIELAQIQSQPDVNPSHLEKETHCPKFPTSDLMGIQERIHPYWMNTSTSSSHPSPRGHPDHVSTPISSSKISLNEAMLSACFIQESFR
ncbi:hypothetical protein Nepgr_012424 [Nepenthes gracilis]|uniref:Uncharacterized protein n=1 Tax=Nepenthes gracilis TaxID=150966 RepID=A0AAD3SFZ1_NEPGR|nr:hypothetical protein Nepgr_012424 [Nepenthes gracilis]